MNIGLTPKSIRDVSDDTAEKKSLGRTEFVLLLLHDVAHCLTVVTLLFVFLIRIVTVEGDSMLPTLQEHDVLILLSSHWYQEPEAGDVVVARIPEFSNGPIVKRVVAVEGDVVDYDPNTGAVTVNGQILAPLSSELPATLGEGLERIEFPVTVASDCVFLLGDNRGVSLDSRYAMIGQVDKRCVLGKVIFVAWPGVDEQTHSWDLGRFGVLSR